MCLTAVKLGNADEALLLYNLKLQLPVLFASELQLVEFASGKSTHNRHSYKPQVRLALHFNTAHRDIQGERRRKLLNDSIRLGQVPGGRKPKLPPPLQNDQPTLHQLVVKAAPEEEGSPELHVESSRGEEGTEGVTDTGTYNFPCFSQDDPSLTGFLKYHAIRSRFHVEILRNVTAVSENE